MQRVASAITIAFFLVTLIVAGAPTVGAEVEPSPARQREILHMLYQDCGSCHGLTLRGGLGPALTPEALAGKSSDVLRVIILYGRPGTPMPPWQDFLTNNEADWLAQRLIAGVPR